MITEKLKIRQEEQKIKYLVVDDEIAANKIYQQDFVADINVPNSTALFAASSSEAIDIIKEESDLSMCFLDYRLEPNIVQSQNLASSRELSSGMLLIPEIASLKEKFPIVIFSAYVGKTTLMEEADFPNVIGFLEKGESAEVFRQVFFKALKTTGIDLKNISEVENRAELFFDYNLLDSQIRNLVIKNTKLINSNLKKTSEYIVKVGKYISEVKSSLPHGQYYAWLNLGIGIEPMSASRFIRAYEMFGSVDFSEIDIAPSAMYLLIPNNVPNEVFQATIEQAKAGKKITRKVAKSIKAEYSSSAKTKTDEARKSRSFDIIDISAVREESQEVKPSAKPQNIVKYIPQQREWQLGVHRVFCCDPNSPLFLDALPNKVALALSFPRDRSWHFRYEGYVSGNSFYSELSEDLDAINLDYADNLIRDMTEGNDSVVICFIPNAKILTLIDALHCKAYIADPEREKCLALSL